MYFPFLQISDMDKITRILIIILFALTNRIAAQGPVVKKVLEWSQKGYYILNPAFANKVGEIGFVRMLSGKDSSVTTSSFFKGVKENVIGKNKMNVRLYDPVVCLMDVNTSRLSIIDYGWSPSFSPNDTQIVYACQARPLQKNDKLFAAAYEGNSIKLFNTYSHKFDVLAMPEKDYFSDPSFTDSAHVIYKTGNRINGPYGADVSFSLINVNSKESSASYQPVIKYKLNDLMGEPYIIRNKIAYTVYSPADSGSGVAGEYLHLLLSGKDTLHNFGVRKFTNLNYKFALSENNDFLFLDDGYYMAEDTNYLVTYKNKIAIDRKPLPENYNIGYLSPHGKYLLYFSKQQEAYLINTTTFQSASIDIPKKEVHTVVWADDEKRLAIVLDDEQLIGTDKLFLFRIE